MVSENIEARGLVSFTLTDEHGIVKQEEVHNLVVNSGLAYIISSMRDAATAVASHMAVGTSTTAAAATQTALVAEIVRAALTSTTIVTTTVSNDSIQYVATFGPGVGTGALTEAGILNAASAGILLARTVFPVINKGALGSLVVTWKITVA